MRRMDLNALRNGDAFKGRRYGTSAAARYVFVAVVKRDMPDDDGRAVWVRAYRNDPRGARTMCFHADTIRPA